MSFSLGRFLIPSWESKRSRTCDRIIPGTSPLSYARVTTLFHDISAWYGELIRLQLSVYRGTGGIQAIMNSKARKLAEQDESMVMASGIPYTVVRAGSLQNTPGGKQGFSFKQVLVISMGINHLLWLLQLLITLLGKKFEWKQLQSSFCFLKIEIMLKDHKIKTTQNRLRFVICPRPHLHPFRMPCRLVISFTFFMAGKRSTGMS